MRAATKGNQTAEIGRLKGTKETDQNNGSLSGIREDAIGMFRQRRVSSCGGTFTAIIVAWFKIQKRYEDQIEPFPSYFQGRAIKNGSCLPCLP